MNKETNVKIGLRRAAAAVLAAMLVVTNADFTVFAAGAKESTASETMDMKMWQVERQKRNLQQKRLPLAKIQQKRQ